jgi:NodT family efflux transporter outer membrane factor (OMF) lipoprotein
MTMRKPNTARAVGTLTLTTLLLAGCAAVGPNFRSPALPTTPGYAMAGDAPPGAGVRFGPPAAGPWWTDFGPPALDQLEQQALSGSPTIAEADAALDQARASLAAARGGLQPSVDLNAGAQRERINLASFGFNAASLPGFSNNPEFSLYSVGGTVAFPLDIFGGQRRAVEGAAARAESIARRGDAAALSLTGQVATTAVQIAGLKAEIAAVEAMVADDRQTAELVRRAEAVGGEAEGARIGAATQIARDEAMLPPLRQALTVARHQLALLLGKAPTDFVPPELELKDFRAGAAPVALPSDLVHLRPDIQQAEADLHAATAEVGVATAALYPSLNLSASLTQSALTPDKIFNFTSTAYTLGVGLAAPIYDGGRRRAEREAARAAARVALARYESTVLLAFNQVADRLQSLAHDDETLAAETKSETAALENLRLARAAYQLGGTGLLPVIDAQRTAGDARRARVAVETQRALDTVQLIVASGARWRAAR